MYVIPIGLFGGIGAAMSPYRTIYHVEIGDVYWWGRAATRPDRKEHPP